MLHLRLFQVVDVGYVRGLHGGAGEEDRKGNQCAGEFHSVGAFTLDRGLVGDLDASEGGSSAAKERVCGMKDAAGMDVGLSE